MEDVLMEKLICGSCGEVEKASLEGYAFGDRLLEGVMFTVHSGGSITPNDNWDKDQYLSGLNKEKWLRKARAHIIDGGIMDCFQCDDEVEIT